MRIVDSRYLTCAKQGSDYPGGGLPEVAFVGRSNVGKSSLINTLIGRSLARVSRTPGRTQGAHFYCVNDALLLVDLPGYGYARAPRRIRDELLEIIDAYLNSGRPLALAALVVDGRHEPSELDHRMNDWLKEKELPTQIVSTKMDKLSRQERNRSMSRSRRLMGREDIIPFSSQTGEGKRGLWQAIDSRIACLRNQNPDHPAGGPQR